MPVLTVKVKHSRRRFRIVLLGSKGVGKSAIGEALSKPRLPFFSLNKQRQERTVFTKVMNGCTIEVHDTKADVENSDWNLDYIIYFDAFIIVYAINDVTSFNNVSKIKEFIVSARGENVSVVVAANKSDLPSRRVDRILADCIVSIDWECRHYEISARTKQGIPDMLKDIVCRLKNKQSGANSSSGQIQRKFVFSGGVYKESYF